MTVVTALTNYNISDIHNFVSSLTTTNPHVRKIALYYNPKQEVKQYLINQGWEVYTYSSFKYFINFERRNQMAKVIKELNLDNETICCTDMRDVYFSKSLDNINLNFYIGIDSKVPIKEDEWNSHSIKGVSYESYLQVENELPLCAGVIIGNGKLVRSFFNDCYSLGTNSNYKNLVDWCPVDQGVVNILAHTKYRNFLQTFDNEDKIVLNMANILTTDRVHLEGYKIYHQYERNKKHYEYVVNLNKKSYI